MDRSSKTHSASAAFAAANSGKDEKQRQVNSKHDVALTNNAGISLKTVNVFTVAQQHREAEPYVACLCFPPERRKCWMLGIVIATCGVVAAVFTMLHRVATYGVKVYFDREAKHLFPC